MKREEISKLIEQVRIMDNKISQLYKMMILKEVAPDLFNHFKTDMFSIDDSAYESYKTNLIHSPEFRAIRNRFVIEQEYLTSCLSQVENDVSYKKRCEVFDNLIRFNTAHKPTVYFQAICNAFCRRDLEYLTSLFGRMEKEPDAWNIISVHCWLFYISFCLLKGEKEKAIELLKEYNKHFKCMHLANKLPVAQLAEEIGIKDKNISRAAVVFRAFDKSEKEKVFEEMIKGKRVAIVGNGPQEMGTGNGQKIDSYDVVIRFNGAKTEGDFAKDYGTKTTILARWLGTPFPSKSLSLLGYAEDIYYVSFWDKAIDDLYEYIKDGNKITFFANKNDIAQIGVNTPTTGLQYLWWVKHVNPDFSMDDCYGFSFKDKETSAKPIDYHDLRRDLSKDPHNMIKEKEVILKLLEKERK